MRLDGVDVLAAGVEPVADRALGVLVAEPGAHRQQHRRRGVVLAGDQLERAALVGELLAGGLGDPRLDRRDHLERRVVRGRGGLGQGLGRGSRWGRRRSWQRQPSDHRRPADAAQARSRRLTSWTSVSPHGIPVCGTGVRPPETCSHDQPRVRDAPRGTPPRGPRSYAQHDLLASLTAARPPVPRPTVARGTRPAKDRHLMSDQRYSAIAGRPGPRSRAPSAARASGRSATPSR